MIENPATAYYPAEEAYMRNPALEAPTELYAARRKIKLGRA